MKYRIQFKASFDNTNSNNILNEIEGVKTKVYEADSYKAVNIIRKTEKKDSSEINATVHSSVDFDASQVTHSDTPSGTEFVVDLDISFSLQQDFYDCINYLESIKSLAINTSSRFGRYFECMHDESPLRNDGGYSYIDFDGSQLTYPL